eukprot:821998_1
MFDKCWVCTIDTLYRPISIATDQPVGPQTFLSDERGGQDESSKYCFMQVHIKGPELMDCLLGELDIDMEQPLVRDGARMNRVYCVRELSSMLLIQIQRGFADRTVLTDGFGVPYLRPDGTMFEHMQ